MNGKHKKWNRGKGGRLTVIGGQEVVLIFKQGGGAGKKLRSLLFTYRKTGGRF